MPRFRLTKPTFIALILLVQAAFVAYGLGLVFWVLNEWFAERALNALFGAGLGGGAFFAAWFAGRDWARAVWRRRFSGVEPSNFSHSGGGGQGGGR